jgi:hypothetical protein
MKKWNKIRIETAFQGSLDAPDVTKTTKPNKEGAWPDVYCPVAEA